MSSRKGRKRRETPSIASAAGLIRFFEESELRFALKPYYIIALAIIFVAIVVVLAKTLPPGV